MDPETEFDTDIMILDYVCSRATHALLLTRIAELSNRPAHADFDILKIFNTWHLLTSHKHSATRQLSADLNAKLRLISFTAQFCFRARKSQWRESHTTPSSIDKWEKGGRGLSSTAYMAMLEILRIPQEERLDDRDQVLSLCDLFSDFLNLCASMSSVTEENDEDLLEVLGKYILQAVLEQYTLFGNTADEAITRASSLLQSTYQQYPSSSSSEREKTAEWLSIIRSRYLTILLPPPTPLTASQPGESEETHLKHLAQQFPAFEYEASLVMKLQSFLFGLETPVLVKLETGEMDLQNCNGGT